MDKKAVIIIGSITGLIFVICILWTIFILQPSETQLVEIVQGGEVIRTVDLLSAEDEEIYITAENGTYNVVSIHEHTICISEAGCPDQTCVHMGILHSQSLPIVCLPNQLIIRYVDEDVS